MRVQEKAFDIGRAIGKHPLASRLFCLVEPLLPLQRIARSGRVVAFRHPRPSYDPHILIVPTTPFPALETSSVTIEDKALIVWEMIVLARSIAAQSGATWQLVINGGIRQDIGQVHGHLIHSIGDADHGLMRLNDPGCQPDGWQDLFDRIHRAAQLPGNGYSVAFRFDPDNRVSVAFSESIRS